jgi:hypothetical protein
MAKHHVSRGEVISLIAGIPLALTAAAGATVVDVRVPPAVVIKPSAAPTASPTAAPTSAEAGIKARYQYVAQVAPGWTGGKCHGCQNFVVPTEYGSKPAQTSCKVIPGAVGADGYCTAFVAIGAGTTPMHGTKP